MDTDEIECKTCIDRFNSECLGRTSYEIGDLINVETGAIKRCQFYRRRK